MGQAPLRLQGFGAVAIAAVGVVVAILGPLSCSNPSYPAKVDTVIVGVPSLEQDALIYIADQQKLFAGNGLSVVVKDYDSGVTALDALLKGEVDVAEAAEFPFVGAAFQKRQVRLIASNDRFENDYVVGRKDRGIESISDLKGKRIGVARQTIAEFYLGRFIALHGIGLQDVTLVDLKPAQFVSAIAGGDVDALIAWQPHIGRIQQEVTGVVVWPAQSSQPVYSVLVVDTGWLSQHSDTAQRFLKSLAEAEDYLVRHPNEAKAIVQRRLNYDDAYIAGVWARHQFALSLYQTLVVAMKDEAQWMINNQLTSEQQIPDFSDYIYIDGLKASKPDVVNIIR